MSLSHVKLIPILFATLALATLCSVAKAEVRIYGGPVPSAGSGRYYPPGGDFSGAGEIQWIGNRSSKPTQHSVRRIDLNPLFVPGSAFTPPGYVPAYYPRSSYFPHDYFGYGLGSATAP